MKIAIVILAALALTGCATTASIQKDLYEARVAEQSKVDQEKEKTKQARYSVIAKLTDPSAQLAFAISDGIASALAATGAGQQQLPGIPNIEGWDDKLIRLIGVVANPTANTLIALDQGRTNRDSIRANKEIQLGDQQSRVDSIEAAARNARLAGDKPSLVIKGNGNGVGGSQVDNSRTDIDTRIDIKVNQCASGNGAPGGNAGAGGSGGENGAGGNSAAGNAAPSGQVPCSISK